MDPKAPQVDAAAQGIAVDLLGVWRTLAQGFGPLSKALGLEEKPPFDVAEVRAMRVEITDVGERILAPVTFEDLRPVTTLFLDMKVMFDDKQATILSRVYIDEQLVPEVIFTDISEFDIFPEDVKDGELSDEALERIQGMLKVFPVLSSAFLRILIKTRSKKGNEEEKG